jgi:hypothetical protein
MAGVVHSVVHVAWRYAWAGVELAPRQLRRLAVRVFDALDRAHDAVMPVREWHP